MENPSADSPNSETDKFAAPVSAPLQIAGATSHKLNWIAASGAAASYVIIQFVLARMHVANPLILYGVSFVSLILTICYTVALARTLKSAWLEILCLAIAAASILPFILLPFWPIHSQAQFEAAKRVYLGYLALFRAVPGLRGLLLVSFAVAVGCLLSRLVREIKLLLPIGVVLALVDVYVVFGGGLVTQANTGKAPAAQAAMHALTVGLTPVPSPNAGAPAPLAVGFADFLFIALFFACFARFSIPSRRTFVLLCSILCLYMGAVIVFRLDLPALVPIAVVVIGSNLAAFRYKRAEAFALLYACLIVFGILGLMVFLAHR